MTVEFAASVLSSTAGMVYRISGLRAVQFHDQMESMASREKTRVTPGSMEEYQNGGHKAKNLRLRSGGWGAIPRHRTNDKKSVIAFIMWI